MQSIDKLSEKGILFDAKPDAVPYNYRISYKVSLICIMIKLCCGRRGCSLLKMHIILNGISNDKMYKKIIHFIKSKYNRDFIVRFDPSINRALEYALGDGLIAQQINGSYKLLEKGRMLVEHILQKDDLLINEKKMLKEISVDLTEELIKEISERWNYTYVKSE